LSFDIIDPTIDEQSLEAELVSLFAYKPIGKFFFIDTAKSGMVFCTLLTKKID
jgi:hypothetical protein